MRKLVLLFTKSHSLCCNCKTDISHNQYNFGVAEDRDDEGYYWRMFCEKCTVIAKEEIQQHKSLEYVYNKYPASEQP